VQVQVREIQRGLGLGHLRLAGRDLGAEGVDLLASRDLGPHLLPAFQTLARIEDRGLVPTQRRLRGLDCQLEAPGLDLDQDLLRTDRVAFREMDVLDGASDAGRDLDLLESLDGSDRRDQVFDLAGDHRHDLDRIRHRDLGRAARAAADCRMRAGLAADGRVGTMTTRAQEDEEGQADRGIVIQRGSRYQARARRSGGAAAAKRGRGP
jgi:hypothetical protein